MLIEGGVRKTEISANNFESPLRVKTAAFDIQIRLLQSLKPSLENFLAAKPAFFAPIPHQCGHDLQRMYIIVKKQVEHLQCLSAPPGSYQFGHIKNIGTFRLGKHRCLGIKNQDLLNRL